MAASGLSRHMWARHPGTHPVASNRAAGEGRDVPRQRRRPEEGSGIRKREHGARSSTAGMTHHVQIKHPEARGAWVIKEKGAKGSTRITPTVCVCAEHAASPASDRVGGCNPDAEGMTGTPPITPSSPPDLTGEPPQHAVQCRSLKGRRGRYGTQAGYRVSEGPDLRLARCFPEFPRHVPGPPPATSTTDTTASAMTAARLDQGVPSSREFV
ncbi:hypothetical protein IOCL1545_000516100 [Leishmania shawi]|uniref:Uncharacterized protein n=1 Tax=Leishmania shawi TaxID=5680 RepID=A0ABR3E3R4_9TRYP